MITMSPAPSPRDLRNAYGCFPSGVTAICALVNGQPVGMIASSFTSVSLEPPLVSVCMQNTSQTWQALASVSRLGVSFLGVTHNTICRQLAAKTDDRFSGIEWQASAAGAIFLDGASVWLECSVEQRIAAGDHEIVLLRIAGLRMEAEVSPLVFHASRFQQLAAL
jgi:flavin reductase (DIM6/NTAB) family NADH-FMN oxidoreductase RutF